MFGKFVLFPDVFALECRRDCAIISADQIVDSVVVVVVAVICAFIGVV